MTKLSLFLSLCLTVALVGCKATVQNFDIGRLVNVGKQLADQGPMTLEQELELGDQMTALMLGAAPLHRDQKLQRYVNQVGMWVAMQSDRADLPWTFAVIDSSDLNAFAMPGGYVLVTSGLLDNMSSESELAGVLAHEIAHVVMRHHVREIERQKSIGLLSDVAFLASDTYHSNAEKKRTDTDYLKKREIAETLLSATHELYTKGLHKDDEFAADRLGLLLSSRAGYDSYGLAAVMQTLTAVDPGDSHLALLFTTHPPPEERLQAMQSHLEKLGSEFSGQMGRQRFLANIR